MWQESPNLPLHNPNFGIFIASMVPEIFAFLGTDTARPDFEITTFIFIYSSDVQKTPFAWVKIWIKSKIPMQLFGLFFRFHILSIVVKFEMLGIFAAPSRRSEESEIAPRLDDFKKIKMQSWVVFHCTPGCNIIWMVIHFHNETIFHE